MKLPSWTTIKNITLDILFPPVCLVCEKNLEKWEEASHLCASCLATIPINDTLFCAICKARLPENTKICHERAIATLAAASLYINPAVKSLIWKLKYGGTPAAGKALTALLTAYLNRLDYDLSDYVIIPIPLHPKRFRERGFNQAEILGQGIAVNLNLPIASGILLRAVATRPQAEMQNRESREKNIIGCFAIKPESMPLKNKNIILVDDVFTSGATTLEAARVLKTVGAKKILILVAAKGV